VNRMFDTLLIANRGEIACRVIRSCRKLGITSIAVYSDADAGALHVRMADQAVRIGGPSPAESYLRIEAIVDAARTTGAQAIHPGYGFLSENPQFAEAVSAAGLVFIGPHPDSMRKMASKAEAKRLMAHHGVPVVPGYTGTKQDASHLAGEATKIGYPLMIKAAYGGGGKGMRIVTDAAGFAEALAAAQREATHAFGDPEVILERYLERPRHIEMQIFGDHHGHTIHLNERECSAQRRYQKVLEESPSPFVTPQLRAQMGEAAVAAARAVDYVGAGTVEFIVAADGRFYFMEMNTRLQVEHPVTEMTLDLDLVEMQLRVAAGAVLPTDLLTATPLAQGHAIEVRLYAEDPQQGFLPGSGRLTRLRLPVSSTHVRVDSGVEQGDMVSVHYDPMIAKLSVWDSDRERALSRLREALAECSIRGPKSNIAFLEQLVRHPVVVEGRIDTAYLDRALPEFLPADTPIPDHAVLAAACLALLDDAAQAATDTLPWAATDAWRIHGRDHQKLNLHCRDLAYEIEACGHDGHYAIRWGEQTRQVDGAHFDGSSLLLAMAGHTLRLPAWIDGTDIELHHAGQRYRFTRRPSYVFETAQTESADEVHAPMPGRIVLVKARAGDTVSKGDALLMMEAMKMELTLRAPRDGVIDHINATTGEFVEADTLLVRLS